MNALNDGGLNNQSTTLPINSEQATTYIIERTKQLVNKAIEIRGNDKPPFLPNEYAKLKGIKSIVKADLGKTSGLLLRFHDGPVIKVNQNQNLARQNFSCAHEIGHILFSELKLENYVSSIEHRTFNPQAKMKVRADARERLCDAAATELLMPENIFKKYLSQSVISIPFIEKLADIFKVSIQTAAWRIAELSSEPCIAIIWKLIPTTNIIKLSWKVRPNINNKKKVLYSPVHTKISSPSLLHKAFESNDCVKFYKDFKVGNTIKRILTEAKGYGRGENRYVVSLTFPER